MNTINSTLKGEYNCHPAFMIELVNSSALQSWKSQLIGMSLWYRGALCSPSIVGDSGQLDLRCSTTDIPAPQSAALGLNPVARKHSLTDPVYLRYMNLRPYHQFSSKTEILWLFDTVCWCGAQWSARKVWSAKTRQAQVIHMWRSRSEGWQNEPGRCHKTSTQSGTKTSSCKPLHTALISSLGFRATLFGASHTQVFCRDLCPQLFRFQIVSGSVACSVVVNALALGARGSPGPATII